MPGRETGLYTAGGDYHWVGIMVVDVEGGDEAEDIVVEP